MERVLNSLLASMILNILTNAELATGNLVDGSAYQSSTHGHCNSSKALDGVKEFRENSSSCTCSVTAVNKSPRWWEMDFGSKHLIDSIVVTGRTDTVEQSQNLGAYISNDTMGPNNGLIVHSPDLNTIGFIVHFSITPRIAQYINIKKDIAEDVLTICEVEVFEAIMTACPFGYFGDMCLRRCHCKSQCGVITGHCIVCEPGWEPPTCEVCSQGYYGQTCSKECSKNCRNDICNAADGKYLLGCKPGFDFTVNKNGSSVCLQGYFGQDCNQECSPNCFSDICNAEDGNCVLGCKPGFDYTINTNCSSYCHPGFYDDCYTLCGQCEQLPCNKTDGFCTGSCAEGYAGYKCDKECLTGSYGDMCSSNCSQQCIAEECHHVSGICNLGCKPGYDFRIDPKCETLCELCRYGEGCIHDCHCANGNICDGVTGDCAPPECEQGWTGSSRNSHKSDERRFTASEVAGVALGSVGCCLLLLGLVFASILVYRRYKSTSTKSDTTNAIPNIDYVNTGRTYEGLFVMPLQNIDGHTYQTIQN